MKFPTPNRVVQVCRCQSEARECYNKFLRTAEKDKKHKQAQVVSDQRSMTSGPISKDLDP